MPDVCILCSDEFTKKWRLKYKGDVFVGSSLVKKANVSQEFPLCKRCTLITRICRGIDIISFGITIILYFVVSQFITAIGISSLLEPLINWLFGQAFNEKTLFAMILIIIVIFVFGFVGFGISYLFKRILKINPQYDLRAKIKIEVISPGLTTSPSNRPRLEITDREIYNKIRSVNNWVL